jgi:uncharacterized protein HemX
MTETVTGTPNLKIKSAAFLILLIILLGIGFYFWHAQKNNADQYQTVTTTLNDNQAKITELQNLEQQLLAQQSQINAQIQTLNAAKSPTILGDAIYLLQQAEYQLTIEQNRTATIDLLNLAQQRISILNSIKFNELAQKITRDIATINAVNAPSQADLINHFTALNRQIAALSFFPAAPVTQSINKPVPNDNSWRQQLMANIKSLRNIVVVQHTDALYSPVLNNEELALFKQYLQSILQQALWAALQNNPSAYQASLTAALSAINQRFANSAPNVMVIKQEINALQQINTAPYTRVKLSSLAFAMNMNVSMNPTSPDGV